MSAWQQQEEQGYLFSFSLLLILPAMFARPSNLNAGGTAVVTIATFNMVF